MNIVTRRNLEALAPSPFSSLDQLLKGFFVRPMNFDVDNLGSLKVDVREDEKSYRIHAELPGVKKENIEVQIDGDVVSISAEVKQQSEEKDGDRLLHSERYYGKLSRSFRLAHEVDETAAKATFVDGVLELSLPKKPVGSGRTHLTIE